MKCDSPWRKCFLGINTSAETAFGNKRRVFLNNGATPLILKPVSIKANKLFPCFTYLNEYNCNSKYITEQYNIVRQKIAEFVHVDLKHDAIIFTRTATEGLNLVARIFQQLDPECIVLSTCLEHMANYLSFEQRLNTKLINLTSTGEIDMDQYISLLDQYQGKVKLVTVTGASNATGYVPPYYEMARLAHLHGAKLMVDAVQTVQHMPFSMLSNSDSRHIDFTVFTAHKCYTGLMGAAVIGPKDFFDSDVMPLIFGAGTNAYTDSSCVILEKSPERYEAGYPDITGIICFGTAIDFLMRCGLDSIEEYEHELRQYFIEGFRQIKGNIIYGPDHMDRSIPYLMIGIKGINYKDLAEKLGYLYGIAVSAGIAGANIYTQILLGLSDEQAYELYSRGESYGTVRISMGMFNNKYEIDYLLCALNQISEQN